MNQIPDEAPQNSTPVWLTRKIYETEAEKKKDFWIGVGLFFGLNVLLGVCLWGVAYALLMQPVSFDPASPTAPNFYGVISCILQLLPWLLNFGLILYFALTRSQIALGMVAGFGIALLITICLGVIFTVWCFVALSGGSF